MMKLISFSFKLCIRLILFGILGLGVLLGSCYLLGPPNIDLDPITVFYDDNGNMLDDQSFTVKDTALEDISPYVKYATIAIEDKHFYEHHGFDFRGIARAIIKNIQSGHLKEGASTITQQYARNLYLSHEKTWVRKFKEAIYTIRLEMFYSKDVILEGYLNTIYYGHGAYGIGAASSYFFHKSANELTLSEAAMLAGIPKGPTYYSPFNDKEKAIARQQTILKQLLEQKYITQAEYYTAKKEKIHFADQTESEEDNIGYYRDFAAKEAADILNEDYEKVLASGYHIYTTLNKKLQKDAESHLERLVKPESELEISMITLRPNDGAVLSMLGGTNYIKSPFNRAVNAKRMVGSAFKPFVYYAALEHGYTPSTTLLSEPTSFALADGEVYNPHNYNGYYANKPITLSKALALSDNIYAVKTNLFLKPETVIETTRKFGITSTLPNVPSLALGSASISLLEMSEAYGVIANGGKTVEGYSVKKIENRYGKVIYEKEEANKKQVLDEQKAFILAHLMTGMFDRRLNGYMEVTGSSIIDQLTHLYAGKSGTTDSDNWMIGFTPKMVTGIWTGFDDNRPIQKSSDKVIAKKLWAATIESAHNQIDNSDFPVPKGIVKKMTDPETGLLATKDCPVARLTYFEEGTEPEDYCAIHEKKSKKEKKQSTSLWKRLLDLFR